MASGAPKQQSNTSLMYFFAALGLLLLVSTLVPSCHSRHAETGPWVQKPEVKGYVYHPAPTPTPPPAKSSTSPTPPAKPTTPSPPPPPHH